MTEANIESLLELIAFLSVVGFLLCALVIVWHLSLGDDGDDGE